MKNIEKTFLLLLVILLGTSCTVQFDRYYNNQVSEFPNEFIGKYRFISSKKNHSDTTYIYISKDSLVYHDKMFLNSGKLGKNFILSKGKKLYYFCQKDTFKQSVTWAVYPLKLTKNNLIVYVLDAEHYKKYFNKHFEIIDSKNDLYKMNEKAFDKLCDKKLSKKNSIKFLKIE
ncbi:MAG: hypothetical protein HUU47_10575 [Bacteroidetes bacterium]|nr:hypothetical protein [Bacteroidota bacterium]